MNLPEHFYRVCIKRSRRLDSGVDEILPAMDFIFSPIFLELSPSVFLLLPSHKIKKNIKSVIFYKRSLACIL